jgi:hypothetical protein
VFLLMGTLLYQTEVKCPFMKNTLAYSSKVEVNDDEVLWHWS